MNEKKVYERKLFLNDFKSEWKLFLKDFKKWMEKGRWTKNYFWTDLKSERKNVYEMNVILERFCKVKKKKIGEQKLSFEEI